MLYFAMHEIDVLYDWVVSWLLKHRTDIVIGLVIGILTTLVLKAPGWLFRWVTEDLPSRYRKMSYKKTVRRIELLRKSRDDPKRSLYKSVFATAQTLIVVAVYGLCIFILFDFSLGRKYPKTQTATDLLPNMLALCLATFIVIFMSCILVARVAIRETRLWFDLQDFDATIEKLEQHLESLTKP